ncbi:MAG: hypothetical protein H7Z38_21715 [Rubrivivax sp.]|nr:hypothetical protein [Pyrinomonadaceae bacterium]
MSENSSQEDNTDPVRVKAFALFFKRYMSVSAIVVAALPIPVTSLGLIPTFGAQTNLLSVYTPLFCFLTPGLLFYLRHQFARIMFPGIYYSEGNPVTNFYRSSLTGLIPLLLIACSVVSVFQYNDVLVLNANMIKDVRLKSTIQPALPEEEKDRNPLSFGNILRHTDMNDIPYGSRLMILYLAIFMMAEAAFILMALKEYLQDLIKVSESDLLGRGVDSGPGRRTRKSVVVRPEDTIRDESVLAE